MMAVTTARQLRQLEARAEEWKEFRRTRLLSQTDLARELGVCRRTVSAVEGCEVAPSMRTLRAFRSLALRLERERVVA
jgi:DNA-binding XRE family transcriptional regulator